MFMQYPGHPDQCCYTISAGDVSFSVDAGTFHSIKLAVPANHIAAVLKGGFSVAGQDNAGIEVFLLNQEDYSSWRNGYTTYRYYDSGSVGRGTLDVPLLEWSGRTYYLVFQNQSRTKDLEIVKGNFSLTYSAMYWPGLKDLGRPLPYGQCPTAQ